MYGGGQGFVARLLVPLRRGRGAPGLDDGAGELQRHPPPRIDEADGAGDCVGVCRLREGAEAAQVLAVDAAAVVGWEMGEDALDMCAAVALACKLPPYIGRI